MIFRKENKRRLRRAHQTRKETEKAAVLALRKEVAAVRRKLYRKMRRKGLRSFSTEFHDGQTWFKMPDYKWLPDGTRLSLSMAERHFT